MIGVAPLKDEGRTTNVYCNYEIKNFLHEVCLTHVLIPFIKNGTQIRRRDADTDIRPDATLLLKERIHIEVDMGTMPREQIKARMKVYEQEWQKVLWVAPTQKRMKWLHGLAEDISDIAYFSTLCWSWHLWWGHDRSTILVEELK